MTADAARHGVATTVEAGAQARWASATFSGARHTLTLACAADAWARAAPWLAGLPESELVLRGHLVADLAVVEIARLDDRVTALVEVLTVEER